MDSKIKDTSLPNVWACEDTIFNICMNEIEEFPQYITKLKDIKGKFPKKHLSKAYTNLEVDFVRIRKNGNLVTIEHHSQISLALMRRDFNYLTTLHLASGRIVHPYIFNTGEIPNFTVDYASPSSVYNPIWANTQEIEESVKLNNIKCKISKQEALNVFDVCDLIWMPKFRSDKSIEDIIVELSILSNNLIIEEKLYDIFIKCLLIWAGKSVKDEEKIIKIKEALKMSAMDTEELFKKTIKTARIEGELCRRYEEGVKKGKEISLNKIKERKNIYLEEGREMGLEEGRELGMEEGFADAEKMFIQKLLKKHTPEEISTEYEIPMERILEIEKDNE